MLYFLRFNILFSLLAFLIILSSTSLGRAQSHTASSRKKAALTPNAPMILPPLQILGIRPGISLDSVQRIVKNAGVALRDVPQDTLTNCFADHSVQIAVVDSIMCRLTWMRMSFLFDITSHRLRRLTITPRTSAIDAGQSDDLNTTLLLFFGQLWGNPEINFDPPACFKWHLGNSDVRGLIKRGFPMWVVEG
jgi:hypothetical protein